MTKPRRDDTEHNDTQINDTQSTGLYCNTQHKRHSTLWVIVLNVIWSGIAFELATMIILIMTLLIMTLLIIYLLIMTILIIFNTGDITCN